MSKRLIFTIFAIILIIFVIPTQTTLAQNNATDSSQIVQFESVNPGSPYYVFKRIKETIKLNLLTFGAKNKAKYSQELLYIRLKELAYAVKNNQIGYMENVANRYTNQAGTIIEKYLRIDADVKKQALQYLPILSNLRDAYPANSPYWLMIQYAVDTTKRIAYN